MNKKKVKKSSKKIDALFDRLKRCNSHEVEALMRQIDELRNKE